LLLPLYGAFSPIFSCMGIPLDKIAVCLTCGNEWEVRTAGVGKKRKCPVCGKYRVKMKSELQTDDKKPANPPPVEPLAAEPPGPVEPEEPKVPEPAESRENPGGGGLFYAVLLLGAAGAVWFFVQSRHRAAVRRQQWLEEAEEERHNQRIPAFPGF
jgi:predicted RNA-binding Zn-ribbon protein involved in translation (DUF1610 family)